MHLTLTPKQKQDARAAIEGEGDLQGSTQGCDDFVHPREK